jgi:hypothetical protein
MIATKSPRKALPRIPAKKIPSALIYEIIDGKPIYYKGYREVIAGTKTIEEVIWTSSLRGVVLEHILRKLFNSCNENKYRFLTNRLVIHCDNRTNFSANIAIFDAEKLPVKAADKHYALIPPKIQIEVDIDADLGNFETPDAYIYAKTEKLLDFGVEKMIWSDSKKILVATKDENWEIINWNKEVEVLNGISFNIGKYLKDEESPFA